MSIEPKQYFEGNSTFQEKVTTQAVLSEQPLGKNDVENVCSGFLLNRIYSDKVNSGATPDEKMAEREESLELGARIVLEHGAEIKGQLDANDAAPQPGQNTKADIAKISGGTMSKIMEILTAMLAGQNVGSIQINNVSALFEVLAVPELNQKFGEVMQVLATRDPVVVADLKDALEGTKGGKILEQAINDYLNPEQKQEIALIDPQEIAQRRAENAQKYQHSPAQQI